MDAALKATEAEVKELVGTSDEALRRRTIDKLRELQYALEPPEETMQRLIYTVSFHRRWLISQRRDTELITEPHHSVYQSQH